MEFVPTAAMALLIVSIINFIKFIRAKDTNGLVTQLSVWVAGVVVVLLAAETDWASTINVGDQLLGDLNFASKLFVGLTIASVAMFANDLRAAIDGGDSSRKPKLMHPGDG